jgi:sugar O-acyltransferase (sialic acid O-acetyltransferase NeuD family)
LILIAASGLAREVMAAVEAGDTYEVVGMLDDDVALHGTSVGGAPVLGRLDDAISLPDCQFVVCAGSGQVRRAIVARLIDLDLNRSRYATIIHPSVRIPASCRIGVGSVLLAQVVLTADVALGNHVIAMPHVVLTHDTVVEDYATLCAGVVLNGAVRVGREAYLGSNATVRQGVSVGERSVLGMGAALLEDMPPEQVWAGVPGRPLMLASSADSSAVLTERRLKVN